MLDYFLCKYSIYSLLIVELVAGTLCGALGWRHISTRARAAWDHAVLVTSETVQPDVYRAAPQTTQIVKMPLLVPALGFTSYALHAGHAIAAMFFVQVALQSDGLLAAAAAAILAGLGIGMSRYARALVLRNTPEIKFVRRRVVPCAILILLVHTMIILAIVTLLMGWFDDLSVNVYYSGLVGKWEGHWETMSLRQFIEKPDGFFGPRIAGVHRYIWYAIGQALLAYACGAVLEAVLVLVVARRLRLMSHAA